MIKRGISAIVATVMIILVTVVAISVVWLVVIPMIREDTSFDSVDTRLTVEAGEGYTFWDKTSRKLAVQIKRGNDDAEITGFNLIITTDGNSITKEYGAEVVPGPNEKKLIIIENVDKTPNSIKIVPVFADGKTGSGGIVSENQIRDTVSVTLPSGTKDRSGSRSYYGGGGGGGGGGTTCDNECGLAGNVCDVDGKLISCANTDGDSCLERSVIPCVVGNICNAGVCVGNCNNDAGCNAEGSSCSSLILTNCSNSNLEDSCLEKVDTNCDDENSCTIDSCVLTTGCSNISKAEGTPCDGGECNSEGVCVASACVNEDGCSEAGMKCSADGTKIFECVALGSCFKKNADNDEITCGAKQICVEEYGFCVENANTYFVARSPYENYLNGPENKVYVLTSNVLANANNGVKINSSNIIFDGRDYEVTASVAGKTSVLIASAINITLKNVIVKTNGGIGVRINQMKNATVYEVTIQNPTARGNVGMYIDYSNDTQVLNNHIENVQKGIYARFLRNCDFLRNEIEDSDIGVYVGESSSPLLENLNMKIGENEISSVRIGISIFGSIIFNPVISNSKISIEANEISTLTEGGIQILNLNDSSVINNIVSCDEGEFWLKTRPETTSIEIEGNDFGICSMV